MLAPPCGSLGPAPRRIGSARRAAIAELDQAACRVVAGVRVGHRAVISEGENGVLDYSPGAGLPVAVRHEIDVPRGYLAPASGTAVDLHEGRGGVLDQCRHSAMSTGEGQPPDPGPIANQIGATRASASTSRRLDVEVEPVGRNGQPAVGSERTSVIR